MPFPVPHHLLTFGGPLGGVESWSCSLRLGGFGGQTQAQEETALQAIALAIRARWVDPAAPMVYGNSLAWAKLNAVGIDGKYVNNYTNVYDLSPVGTPATSGAVLPAQCSLVVTLTTGAARGLASKGRIYLPTPKPGTSPTGALTGAQTAAAATWAAGLISDINNVTGVGDVIVASEVREGAIRTVTGVEVGSVIDTQRSRRGKFVEQYAPATVTTASAGGGF